MPKIFRYVENQQNNAGPKGIKNSSSVLEGIGGGSKQSLSVLEGIGGGSRQTHTVLEGMTGAGGDKNNKNR